VKSNIKYRLTILLFVALAILYGLLWLFVLPLKLRLPAPAEELYKRHVLQEIGDSVTDIRVVRTDEYHRNTWLLVYNEQLCEAYFVVRLAKEGFPLF
jgi:hypothetical protein